MRRPGVRAQGLGEAACRSKPRAGKKARSGAARMPPGAERREAADRSAKRRGVGLVWISPKPNQPFKNREPYAVRRAGVQGRVPAGGGGGGQPPAGFGAAHQRASADIVNRYGEQSLDKKSRHAVYTYTPEGSNIGYKLVTRETRQGETLVTFCSSRGEKQTKKRLSPA